MCVWVGLCVYVYVCVGVLCVSVCVCACVYVCERERGQRENNSVAHTEHIDTSCLGFIGIF